MGVDSMLQIERVSLLALNGSEDKDRVVFAKILSTYNDFDMQVFFEWEFKMSSIAIWWLDIAAAFVGFNLSVDPNIQQRKLLVIYQFVRGAPKLFVQCHLCGEPEEIRAREERIRGEQ